MALLAQRGWPAGEGCLWGSANCCYTSGMEIIVSMTTVPERVPLLHHSLSALLAQTYRPDRLILWLYDMILPDGARIGAGYLPDNLLALQAQGLEIRYCRDVGPHTKLLPAWAQFPAAAIVTVDDDTLYPPEWLGELVTSWQAQPDVIHCQRAHYITLEDDGLSVRPYPEWQTGAPGRLGPDHRLFATGHGGVLYPPGSLHSELTNEAVFRQLCPTQDDVWFKAMALLQGTPVRKVAPDSRDYPLIPGTEVRMLWSQNESGNDRQIRAVFAHYALLPLLAD